ncbi:TPA: hypothetical protein ACFCNN_001497, partial [Neisseria gonorrhoeae]
SPTAAKPQTWRLLYAVRRAFGRHFSLILLGEWLTLNVSTFIIQFIGASGADTGRAPPKRGLYRE